jgi:serine protease Do
MRSLTFPFCLAALVPALAAQRPTTLSERKPGLQVVEPDEQDRDLRMTPVVRAVQKAADSVVSIYLNHAQSGFPQRRTVTEGQGSGVVLDASGFVITNWHVIAAAQNDDEYSLLLRLRDGRARRARVLSSSPAHDLALLLMQLEGDERVQPVEIGRSADLMIGETVLAIGNPQGHANTVTSGVLSATGRSITVRAPDNTLREYSGLLQTDAAINQGNSGGALLDITGKLIGINNAMAVGAENIGFAIPVDTVREVFENQLLASESFAAAGDAAWLGMEVAEERGQLVVKSVVGDGPAAVAGVRVGDEVVAAGSGRVQGMLDYARQVLMAPAGRPLPLRLSRSGREVAVNPRPLTRSAGAIFGLTGIVIEEVTADQDRELAERTTRAFYQNTPYRRLPLFPAVLRVRSVQAGSPAAELTIQPGDLLVASVLPDRFGTERDYRIDSARGFESLLRQLQGRSLKIFVLRGTDELIGMLDVRRAEAR